jgi:hypothetical protein
MMRLWYKTDTMFLRSAGKAVSISPLKCRSPIAIINLMDMIYPEKNTSRVAAHFFRRNRLTPKKTEITAVTETNISTLKGFVCIARYEYNAMPASVTKPIHSSIKAIVSVIYLVSMGLAP